MFGEKSSPRSEHVERVVTGGSLPPCDIRKRPLPKCWVPAQLFRDRGVQRAASLINPSVSPYGRAGSAGGSRRSKRHGIDLNVCGPALGHNTVHLTKMALQRIVWVGQRPDRDN